MIIDLLVTHSVINFWQALTQLKEQWQLLSSLIKVKPQIIHESYVLAIFSRSDFIETFAVSRTLFGFLSSIKRSWYKKNTELGENEIGKLCFKVAGLLSEGLDRLYCSLYIYWRTNTLQYIMLEKGKICIKSFFIKNDRPTKQGVDLVLMSETKATLDTHYSFQN